MPEVTTSFLAALVILIGGIFYLLAMKKEKTASRGAATPFLDQYCVDFTALARQGKIDAVIGRENEIKKLTQILSRREKNNALLVGAPGVGKTAIVEGLADQIVKEEIPAVLHDKRILALDVTLLLSGTKYRGDFEDRAKKIVFEIINSERSIILFIDEIHSVIQSQGSEGSINFSDILKPALARGDLQLIGATTYEEYEKYIKTDLSLERRFQRVEVKEPSVKEALHIINNVKDKYREYHRVEFTDGALKTAVTLSQKLLRDRKLPDKALDALDEAGAKVRIAHLHPAVTPLLYQAALKAHPQVAGLWKKLQAIDEKIATNLHNSKLINQREKLEDTLGSAGIMTVDATDIESVIKDWLF